MKKLYKLEQLEALKAGYTKEAIQSMEEVIIAINGNYGADRDLDKDLGGYVVILESEEDVAELKANSIKGLLPEHTYIIKSDDGIDYYSSLFLLSDDYSIVVFSTKELHELLLNIS